MALYSIANAAGAAFRSALNTVLGKIHSNYAGTTDPVSASENAAGMLWVDTNTTPPTLKIRNAANSAWVSVGGVDTSFLLAGTTAFSRTILDDTTAAQARTTLGLTEAVVTTTLASQAEAEAGTNNTKLVTPLRVKEAIDALSPGMIYSAAQTVAGSPSTIDFTGIPAGVNEVDIFYQGLSLSGTDRAVLQIGDSGGFEITGYEAAIWGPSGYGPQATQGWFVSGTVAASGYDGILRLRRMTGNTWIGEGAYHNPGQSIVSIFGTKTLSGELDRVRFNRTGTNTYDAGTAIISYR